MDILTLDTYHPKAEHEHVCHNEGRALHLTAHTVAVPWGGKAGREGGEGRWGGKVGGDEGIRKGNHDTK